LKRPLANKRPIGPFSQLLEEEKPPEEIRYWVIAVFNKPRTTQVSDNQQEEMIGKTLDLDFQDGRGQAFYDPAGGPRSFKVIYRTIWLVTEEANTPVPAEDAIRQSKKIVSNSLTLNDFEYDQSLIHCGRPDRVDELIGPNVVRNFTRADGP